MEGTSTPSPSRPVIFAWAMMALSLFISSSYAQTCRNYTFANRNTYTTCVDLPVLSSFLHWNYTPSTGTADIAFRHNGVTSTSRWISWAVNPTGHGMVGSQALVAYMTSSGSMYAYTSSVDSYDTDLPEGTLTFAVPSISATYTASSGEMTIFARLVLGATMDSVTQVWQEGPMQGPGTPGIHSTSGSNMKSMGTINLSANSSGALASSPSGASSTETKKNVHGVLNAVSWGISMPVGALLARYLKVFKAANPAWFYLHITCQTSAYAVGVAGWVTGLRLGGDGSSKTSTHGNIGLTLFILGTLQVFALLVRPKLEHKYRLYWNIYHHTFGYTAIILSIINVFLGLDILDPTKVWKKVYISVIIVLGCIALIMEPLTWIIVIQRRRLEKSQS